MPLRNLKKKRRSTNNNPEADDSSSTKRMKQQRLDKASSSSIISQASLDQLIIDYIVQGMRQLSTVEEVSFIGLVKGLQPIRKVMTRKTLTGRIEDCFRAMSLHLNQALSAAHAVCTTADIWSTNNKSYLGITAHLISDDFKRHSCALACRRFKGSHTHSRIAEQLHYIHCEYNLKFNKIVCTVTDNASNFGKAFAEYFVAETDASEDGNDNDEEDVSLTDVHDILSTVIPNDDIDADNDFVQLQPHHRCACHSLNLLATTDADKALKTSSYSKINHASFGKCRGIWNLVNRSTKASDAISDLCGQKRLIFPVPTRWNSKFDAVKRLLEFSDKLDQISKALEQPSFKTTEIDFLKEYIVVMEPIATLLDQLQGDANCFNGMLLPKLIQLRHRLQVLLDSSLTFCGPLVTAILAGLNKRFEAMFNLDTTNFEARDAIYAAVSNPTYKLRWVAPDKREQISQLFVQLVVSHSMSMIRSDMQPGLHNHRVLILQQQQQK